MKIHQLKLVQRKLCAFVDIFRPIFGRSERGHWCGMYLSGLMVDGERKSVSAIASRLVGGNEQALQQFVNQSPWPHEEVQERLVDWISEKFSIRKGVLILDDTTLPKKGKKSVGVAHQYSGRSGGIASCQSIVSWHLASGGQHFPLMAELFLPDTWIQDPQSLDQACVPEGKRKKRKKWEIALELLDRLKKKNLPYKILTMDAGYGISKEFLGKLDERGEKYIAQIPSNQSVWPADVQVFRSVTAGKLWKYDHLKNPAEKPLRIDSLAHKIPAKKWKTVRLQTRERRQVKVYAVRVREVQIRYYYPGREMWLLIEKEQDGNLKYYVSNMPERTSPNKMIQAAHARWNIEQGYQQLKEELGLDHFEGRSWPGLHHHITLTFMAHVFLSSLQVRSQKKMFSLDSFDSKNHQPSFTTPSLSRMPSLDSLSRSDFL